MVKLEGHQSWRASGLQQFSDHSGDDCLPKPQSSLLEPDEDIQSHRKRVVCVNQNKTEFLDAVCSQEPEQGSVSPGEVHVESRPLASVQHHEADIVSVLPKLNNDSSGGVALPVPEGLSDQMNQNVAGQTYLNSDLNRLETISNGHVFKTQEGLQVYPNLDCSPVLTVASNGPDRGQKPLLLPHILKHKPSSITFSHCTHPSKADGHGFSNESSDDGECSPVEDKEGENPNYGDDDDDDVFKELPQSRGILISHKDKDKQRRRGPVRDYGFEAEGESSSKEVCFYSFKNTHKYSRYGAA